MELLILVIPLAYGVGCLGKKRKIGFEWAFVLSIINIILGLIVTLCSKKTGQIINVDGDNGLKKSNLVKWGYVIFAYGCIGLIIGVLVLLDALGLSFDDASFIDGLIFTVLSIVVIILGKYLIKDKNPTCDKQKLRILGFIRSSVG